MDQPGAKSGEPIADLGFRQAGIIPMFLTRSHACQHLRGREASRIGILGSFELCPKAGVCRSAGDARRRLHRVGWGVGSGRNDEESRSGQKPVGVNTVLFGLPYWNMSGGLKSRVNMFPSWSYAKLPTRHSSNISAYA